jgi:hypothetical protein
LTLGSAQNGYGGLDQWGRIVDQVWQSGGVAVDEYRYGYNQDGNVLWKQNATASGLDELYTNDALGRLTEVQQGTLSLSPSPSITDQKWGRC